MARVDEYASRHPGEPISDYLRKQIPELAVIEEAELRAVPTTAPALWAKEKQSGDTPPDFIKRHYPNCLGHGLTRADIRRLDPQLYIALDNWHRHNDFPDDFDLPTLKESNDRWVSRIVQGDEAVTVRNANDIFNLYSHLVRRGIFSGSNGRTT